VTTVVNTVNNAQVGPLLDFVIDNCENLGGISFQPVSFTGRDEDISDADRHRQRYTLSHLAHDLEKYFDGKIDPYRDWYPLGAVGGFTALADHLRGTEVQFGGLACSCHPNCGSSIFMVANRKTKTWAPVTQFFDVDQFMKDITVITDTARGQTLSVVQTALALLKNFDQRKAPSGLTLPEFIKILNRKSGGAMSRGKKPKLGDWKLMWVGGMWFQDLWTYDFRRTEMCVIPYATQEGEISFCAYNTGVGWRQIVENMHMVATTKEWFQQRGRHKIYAGDRPMELPSRSLPIVEAPAGAGAAAHSCACH
jgi:hypothetical protein